MLKYYLDRYKTQEMCDKSVDTCLLALKLVPDCFVTNKMFQKLGNFVVSNSGTFLMMQVLILSHFSAMIWVLIM